MRRALKKALTRLKNASKSIVSPSPSPSLLSLSLPLSLFLPRATPHLGHDGIKCLHILRQKRRDLVLVLEVAAETLVVLLALVFLAQGADYFSENVAAVALL